MKSVAVRNVGTEPWCRIPSPDLIDHVKRQSHRGLRGNPWRYVDAVLRTDLQSSRNRVGLRTVVYLQLEADEIPRGDANQQWGRAAHEKLDANVERARRGRELDVWARAGAIDAKLDELVGQSRRDEAPERCRVRRGVHEAPRDDGPAARVG